MGLNHKQHTAYVSALIPEKNPHVFDLCVPHFDKFKPPTGWQLVESDDLSSVNRLDPEGSGMSEDPSVNVVTLHSVDDREKTDQELEEIFSESFDPSLDPFLQPPDSLNASEFINRTREQSVQGRHRKEVHPSKKNVPSKRGFLKHLNIIKNTD